MSPFTAATRTEASQNSQIGRHAVGRGWSQSSGGEDLLHWHWGKLDWKRQFFWSMTVGGWGGEGDRAWVSKLLSECLCFACSCRWPFAYAERQGREMVPASSFVPGGVSLWMVPLWDALRDEQIISPLCAPAFFTLLFLHCMSAGCLPWLFSKRAPMSSKFSQS